MMKIKNWHVYISADLLDEARYVKNFSSSSSYGGKTTLDELIKWLKDFKERIIIIEKNEG